MEHLLQKEYGKNLAERISGSLTSIFRPPAPFLKVIFLIYVPWNNQNTNFKLTILYGGDVVAKSVLIRRSCCQ